ncbi:Sterol 3-beta-glucosyltransferase [Debaryomyces fabryi]|uniref:Sterol 3-beta-glucosyltransferase n=1 Tax=Debaryomyces fabryi TaxID=58627 RepID=A0A0V1PUX3_9ASCO|nr:Sterol 3-beta-glucosyltransferase [Debaryomyces fabryi]KSA00046.1 Sterol 3-beta-glucosyltransferase [Debaryomyces fabryi]CUM45828.1 unnamed protein product [Debaryomyces fabryi]
MLPKEDRFNSKNSKGTNEAENQATSFYKRFSSSIIPPLSFLSQGTISPNNEEVANDDNAHKDEKTFSDDEDIAHPIGSVGSLNNFVSFLYAGMGKLSEIKGNDASNANDTNDASDVGALKLNDKFTEARNRQVNEPYRGEYKIDYDINESEEGDVESAEDENTLKPKTEDVTPNTGLDPEEHLEKVSDMFFDDKDEPTTALASDPSKGTVLQQSVLKNFDPFLIEQTELLKLKDIKLSTDEDESDAYKIKKKFFRLKVADKLKRVFELSDDDYFYGNYSVWLVRDVLLQGHIYLTKESILFFTFLPKRQNTINASNGAAGGFQHHDDSHDVIQSGSLGMKTALYGDTVFSTPLTHRFWVILRNETITVYNSPTDLYFPITLIDLKSCISAEVIEKGKNESSTSSRPELCRNDSLENSSGDEEAEFSNMLHSNYQLEDNTENLSGGFWFKVVTKKKTHKFHSDSLYSARQWVNNIVKVVFQLHNSNSNNEVIMKIPINNIISFDINEVFGASERTSESNDEKPKVLNVKHIENEAKARNPLLASRMKNELKNKTRKKMKRTSVGEADDLLSENTYFLLFKNGDEVFNTLNEIVSENKDANTFPNKRSSIISTFNNEKGSSWTRPKSFAHRGEEIKTPRAISTLTTDHYQNSIIDQIEEASHRKTANAELASPRSECGLTNSVLSLPQSKIKKFGKTLIAPSRIFSNKSRSGSEKSTPDRSGTTSPVQGINLSLSGLKDLNMAFEASQKNYEVGSTRFSHTDNNNADNISSFEYNTLSKAEALSPQIRSPHPIEAGPLNLTDPSEFEDNRKKNNTLSSIGKSIKAMSSIKSKLAAVNHYEELYENDPYFIRDISAREVDTKHFQERFSFNNKKQLIASYHCHIIRAVPVFGKVYLGDSEICFRSMLPGVSTKMILPLIDVDTCYEEKGSNIAYSGLVIVIRGYDELLMEFSVQKARDDCLAMILRQLEKNHGPGDESSSNNKNSEDDDQCLQKLPSSTDTTKSLAGIKLAQWRIENARLKLFEDKINAAAGLHVPIILEDSPFYKTEIRPSTSFNFTLLTIGSRGDVQPYIALAKGLLAEGHNVTIATHSDFEEWIIGHGIKFKTIAGNPVELMSLMVSHGSMSLSFLKEASSKFRGWIQDLLDTSWKACQGSDILIESPSAMVGAHIAEALGIPYMRAFTMPWTRTRAYPHAFIVPDKKKGGSYNYITHLMFETVLWKGISGQVNKWRREQLGIPRTNLYRLAQYDIPFLYNISPIIFPPSVDFPDWVKVTGYWFLDEGSAEDFNPPKELVDFMNNAKEDSKKIVYIGFGSIVVKDAKSLTKAIVEAVLEADVRCILNKGWSDRKSSPKKDDAEPEIELPEEIYNSGSIPHDWLFPKIDAAVHHGGSGTTGATMRAGIPTIIKPFFGDQFFYSSRIEDIGAGIGLKKLNAHSLSTALKKATSDAKMNLKAKKISERLKQENGVLNAIEAIYYELEYARNLITAKQHENAKHDIKSGVQTPVVNETLDEYFDSDAYDTDFESDHESPNETYQQDNDEDYNTNDDNTTEIEEPSLMDDNDTVRIAPDTGNDTTTLTDVNKEVFNVSAS